MGPLRVFAPVTFVSLALGLRIEVALTEAILLGLDGRFSAFGVTLQSPNTLGDDGSPGLSAFGVDLAWRLSKDAQVVLGVVLRQSPLLLSGQGATRVSPQVQDANIDLISGEGTLKIEWRWP